MSVRTLPAQDERAARTDRPAPGALAGARLPLRLVRRGLLLMALTGLAYGLLEVWSYRHTYPDTAARERLAQLATSDALRTFQGVPHGVDTVGGFVAWDAGWFLAALLAVWALLATTRLVRAEEDAGRVDLVLSRPLTARRQLLASLAVVTGGCLLFGLAVAAAMVVLGVPAAGSLLFGLGLAGVGATCAALAAVAAQLVDVRRRAVGVASGAVGVLFAVRMLGNSSDGRGWLLATTPFGWLDRLQPFAGARWSGLLLFAVALTGLGALAVLLRSRRDAGGAVLALTESRPPRHALLGGATAFQWRLTGGTLAAWAAGVGLFGVLMGTLVRTVVDLVEDDPGYRKVLADFGYDFSAPVDAYLAFTAVFFALMLSLYAAWRVGAVRAEEAAGRLEHLLVRRVARRRWLAGSVVSTLLASCAVVGAAGLGTWAGAAVGDAGIGVGDAVGPLLPTLPVVALSTGLAVLAFGVVPRLTVVLPASLVAAAFVLSLLGPMLDAPSWVLDLSPFTWLPHPPEQGADAVAGAVMAGVGLLAAAGGVLAFGRRDVVGE